MSDQESTEEGDGADTPMLEVEQPTVKEGDNGEWVHYLQSLLSAQSLYEGEIDGDFGPITDQAVRAYQGQNGLVVDGVCGPKTWTSLYS